MQKKTVLSILITLIFSSSGFTQEMNSALKSLQIKPKIEITSFQTSTKVNSALNIRVKVTNLTESNIYINEVKIQLPMEFLSARSTISNKELEKATVDNKEKKLDPGNEYLYIFTIPAENSTVINSFTNFHSLKFAPAEYEVYSIVSYKVPPGQLTQTMESTKVKFEPDLISIIWGCLMGSFLSALFLAVFNLKDNETKMEVKKILWASGMLFIKGAICGIIIILLLMRVKDLALPVNISINDFYGGAVLGLFTYKLGDWVYKILTEKVK